MQIIHTFTVQSFSSSTETVTITYVDPDGEEHPVEAKIGKHLLDVAHDNNIELEGMYAEWTYYTYGGYVVSLQHLKLSSRAHTTIHINNIHFWRDKGACGGELACSTCHLVFDQEVYDTLPPKSDEEEDMLDLAFELTET